MAKYNADVQLSPTKPAEDHVDDAVEDEEDDDEGNDETSVKLLNAQVRTRKEPPKDTRRKSTFGRITNGFLGLVGLASQPTSSNEPIPQTTLSDGSIYDDTLAKDEQVPADNEPAAAMLEGEQTPWDSPSEDEHDSGSRLEDTSARDTVEGGTRTPRADGPQNLTTTPTKSRGTTIEVVIPTSSARKRLPRPKAGPENLANSPKRKRPSPRRDTYEITSSPPEQDDDSDEPAQSPAKQPKRMKQKESKPPLALPKNHKQLVSRHRHLDEAPTLTDPIKNISHRAEQDPSTNGTVSGEPGVESKAVAPKRSVGRPRKNAQSNDQNLMAEPLSKLSNQQARAVTPPSAGDGIEDPDAGDGVSAILLNPSPQKPPHMPRQQQTNSADNDIVNEHVDTAGVFESEPRMAFSDTLLLPKRQKLKPSTQGEFAVDFRTFEGLLTNLGRVGCKYHQKEDRWVCVKREKDVYSREGKRVARRLNKLHDAYTNFRDSTTGGDTRQDSQTRITTIIDALKPEVDRIFTNRLGRPLMGIGYFDEASTRTILTDLYFILLPRLAAVVKVGAEAYTAHNLIELPVLIELAELINLLHDLTATALDQPKESQPEAPGVYQTIQPIQRCLPAIRTLQTHFGAEIKTRKRNQESLERQKTLAEQQKIYLEEEEREELEKRRRNKAIHKAQKAELARKYSDPVQGRLMRVALEKERAKEEERLQIYRAKQAGTQVSRLSNRDMDDDPFADDDFERVSVFGRNNNRKQPNQKQWSSEDKEAFVDIMMRERGEDRYEKAANELGRSIEEIFELAKDLQEAMDIDHENGRMNQPEDEWTYDVWVENN